MTYSRHHICMYHLVWPTRGMVSTATVVELLAEVCPKEPDIRGARCPRDTPTETWLEDRACDGVHRGPLRCPRNSVSGRARNK